MYGFFFIGIWLEDYDLLVSIYCEEKILKIIFKEKK